MRDEPAYRAAFDEVASLMDGALTRPLGELVDAPDDELDETGNTQPALFAVEYALARTWLSWGVRPGAVGGHSIREPSQPMGTKPSMSRRSA